MQGNFQVGSPAFISYCCTRATSRPNAERYQKRLFSLHGSLQGTVCFEYKMGTNGHRLWVPIASVILQGTLDVTSQASLNGHYFIRV